MMRLPSFLKMPAFVFEPSAPLAISACNQAGMLKNACHGSLGRLSSMVLATWAKVSKPTTSAVR